MKKLFSIVAILVIALTAHAGSIKMSTGVNIVRNAGQSILVAFTASGWLPGQTAQVWLLNSRTWQLTLVWIDQPVQNGANLLNLDIPWAWAQSGRYLVKVVCGNTQGTSTWAATIRTAVKYPWQGITWNRGWPAAVTWVVEGSISDYTEVSLESEDGSQGCFLGESEVVDIAAGRLDFTIPSWLTPGVYRIHIDCFVYDCEYDEFDQPWFFLEFYAGTQSERITIQ